MVRAVTLRARVVDRFLPRVITIVVGSKRWLHPGQSFGGV